MPFVTAEATTLAQARFVNDEIEAILAEHGRDGFLSAWLRARDVGWAADLIPDLTNLEPQP